MSTLQFVKAWRAFWFEPKSPLPIALYRILFGMLVIQTGILLLPDLLTWYGSHAVVSVETAKAYHRELLVDALLLLPETDQWLYAFFYLFMAAATCLTVGLFTRTSALLVFLALSALHHRNWTILNSGDIFMRLAALYLSLSPAGRALSLDRLLAVWISPGHRPSTPQAVAPWVQRLLQVQLAMLYCQAFWTKMAGMTWLNGDALYYVVRLEDFQRCQFPLLSNNLMALKLLTWSALFVEFALWTLVWFKDLRYLVLLAGVMMHVSIDLLMNLPIFEYLMITAYILFVEPEDLALIMEKVRRVVRHFIRDPLLVVFDGSDSTAWRMAETIRRMDIFRLVNLVDCALPEAKSDWARLTGQNEPARLAAFDASKMQWSTGRAALAKVCRLIPWAIPLYVVRDASSASEI